MSDNILQSQSGLQWGTRKTWELQGRAKKKALHHHRLALERNSCPEWLLQDLQYQELREAEELGCCILWVLCR